MSKRLSGVSFVVLAALCLAACLLIPGNFTSTLDVRRDGHFSFAYKGEILVFNPAAHGAEVAEKDDPAALCFGPPPGAPDVVRPIPGTVMVVPPPTPRMHACTPKERADRSAQIIVNNANAAERRKKEGEQMAKLIGLDPNDDSSMAAYAGLLRKQAGWRTVTYRGKGVYDVDFEQSGMLDRDFVFPVLPKATTLVPFVVIHKRADGAVLVNAPGYTLNPMASIAAGFGNASALGQGKPPASGPRGSFTITTDAVPLTNNTEDGPSHDGDRTVLRWVVGAPTNKVPEALLPLSR